MDLEAYQVLGKHVVGTFPKLHRLGSISEGNQRLHDWAVSFNLFPQSQVLKHQDSSLIALLVHFSISILSLTTLHQSTSLKGLQFCYCTAILSFSTFLDNSCISRFVPGLGNGYYLGQTFRDFLEQADLLILNNLYLKVHVIISDILILP